MTHRGAPGARPGGSRAGASAVEAMVALLLTLFLMGLLAGLAARYRTAAATLVRRTEVMEARRVARDLVGRGVDGGGVRSAGDSPELPLRNYVGTALACGGGAWGYRGRRLPDPARDSAWVLLAAGRVEVRALTGTGPSECAVAVGGRALRIDLDEGGDAALLLRVFESGRYRVGDAVRYGRPGSGAQPLSGAVLDPGGSGVARAAGSVELRIRGAGDSATVARRWTVR